VILTTASGYDSRFQGDIAEIATYDVALGDADRIAVEGAMMARWAITP
jgi:hypothetical protein